MIMLQTIKKIKGGILMREFSEENILKINELLKAGASLNQLDKSGQLGRSRKSFCNAAKKLGYAFSKEHSAFIKNVTEETQSVTNEKPINIEQKTESKKETTIAELEKRVEILESAVMQLQQASTNRASTFEALELDPRTASDIVSRSIKMSKEAIQLFDFIAENKYPQHSKQALLSQALIEFYENHK